MIIIDIHEPSDIPELLRRKGAQIRIRKLDVADYIIGDIGIERKTFHDFFRSIIDKRIFTQLERLRDSFKKPLLLLEGDLQEALYTVQNPNAILGGLLSVVIDMDIRVVYSRDKEDTVNILFLLWRRIHKEGKASVPRFKPRIMSKRERLLFILEGFPGIGHRLAENILNHYGTIRNFAVTNLSELMSVEGIGEKKAREIIELLTLDYRKLRKTHKEEESHA